MHAPMTYNDSPKGLCYDHFDQRIVMFNVKHVEPVELATVIFQMADIK